MSSTTSRTAAVSTWGSMAVFRASMATAWRIAAPVSSCGWGWPGRSHSPGVAADPDAAVSGWVQAHVTEAGSWRLRALEMTSSWSSSWRGSLTSMPVAIAVIEFSHLTKACASVPQIPVAG